MQGQDFRAEVDMFGRRDVQIGAAVGLIVGLLLGWFALGWWLAPVQWVDARPSDLHPAWQEHYVAMVVDSYALTGDRQTAEARLQEFDQEALSTTFGEVETTFQEQGATRQAQAAQQLADQLGVTISAPRAEAVEETVAPVAGIEPTAPAGGGVVASPRVRRVLLVCGLALAAILIIVAGIAGVIWYQRRTMRFEEEEAEGMYPGLAGEPRIDSMNLGERATVQYLDEGPGYEQTIQIYRGQEIVGSCGLRGVSTLSQGGHVVGCTAWLYEPQTPERAADTRVLVSRQVYEDQAERNLLTHSREPAEVIPAEPGHTAYLEHETLEMTLRVLDVEYADVAERYISRLVVEMEPTRKHREPQQPAPLDIG